MRFPPSARLVAIVLAASLAAGCITEDMIDGRPDTGRTSRHDPSSHDSDYAARVCRDAINSDAYIDCRRKADDARYQPPERKRDPGGLPATPVSASPP